MFTGDIVIAAVFPGVCPLGLFTGNRVQAQQGIPGFEAEPAILHDNPVPMYYRGIGIGYFPVP